MSVFTYMVPTDGTIPFWNCVYLCTLYHYTQGMQSNIYMALEPKLDNVIYNNNEYQYRQSVACVYTV